MGTAAPPCTQRAMRSKQLAARGPIKEELTVFCRAAIADNANSSNQRLEKENLVSREKETKTTLRGKKIKYQKYHSKPNHIKFAETLTCFDDSACDGKVDTAFIAPRTPKFVCVYEKYDISNYLISSPVF